MVRAGRFGVCSGVVSLGLVSRPHVLVAMSRLPPVCQAFGLSRMITTFRIGHRMLKASCQCDTLLSTPTLLDGEAAVRLDWA